MPPARRGIFRTSAPENKSNSEEDMKDPRTGNLEILPDHHLSGGGFRNPWPTARREETGGILRWRRERRENGVPPIPAATAFPRERPRLTTDDGDDRLRITWVGHATFLIQIGGANLLTDPQWSRRASPLPFIGPSRFTAPGIEWEELPPIDAILVSHDHYDHLDAATVRRLRRRFGADLVWFTPLGYRRWFARRGVHRVEELDWWGEATLRCAKGELRIVALPAQHWTSRGLWDQGRRLWASWAIVAPDGAAVYFGGDSGYFPGFTEIGDRAGPFDATLLPIGAYDPRWFMRPVHMNPEEAVRAYLDLGGSGTMIGMHWGTWRLTDEAPLEPPLRARAAWAAAGLAPELLQILPHGGTWVAARADSLTEAG
jgi:N-acyl-phosphatidylethanolamine-hydrolysing phospholipase D